MFFPLSIPLKLTKYSHFPSSWVIDLSPSPLIDPLFLLLPVLTLNTPVQSLHDTLILHLPPEGTFDHQWKCLPGLGPRRRSGFWKKGWRKQFGKKMCVLVKQRLCDSEMCEGVVDDSVIWLQTATFTKLIVSCWSSSSFQCNGKKIW